MKELLEFSFAPANIFPTILLLVVAGYWLIFIVGLLDIHVLDFGFDGADHDIGHDAAHAPGDKAGHGDKLGHGGGAHAILGFFNLGYVPVTVLFSFFALFFWAGSMLGNYYWSQGSLVLTLLVLAAAAVTGLLLMKLATQPLRMLFRSLDGDERPLEYIGAICVIEVGPQGDMLGQAELMQRSRHLLIHVRSESGDRIPPGTRCVILEQDQAKNCFVVSPLGPDDTSSE